MLFQNRFSPRQVPWILVGLIPIMAGCAQDFPCQEATYPVSGNVTYHGRPLSKVEICFFPDDPNLVDRVRPRGKTDEKGRFILWTYVPGDGAPVGTYKVTAIQQEVTVSKGTIAVKPNELPPKYSSWSSTPLKVQIGKGKNEIPTIEIP